MRNSKRDILWLVALVSYAIFRMMIVIFCRRVLKWGK